MTPYFHGYHLGITGGVAMLAFLSFDEIDAWLAGYTDGLADRVVRTSERRFEAQFAKGEA